MSAPTHAVRDQMHSDDGLGDDDHRTLPGPHRQWEKAAPGGHPRVRAKALAAKLTKCAVPLGAGLVDSRMTTMTAIGTVLRIAAMPSGSTTRVRQGCPKSLRSEEAGTP